MLRHLSPQFYLDMKQFIVLVAVLPLMLVFLAQFTLDQINDGKISAVNSIVYSAKERAKEDGYFTEKNKQDIQDKIIKACGVEDKDIYINTSPDSPLERIYNASSTWEQDLIHYEVRVTLSGIMAGGELLGIPKERNKRCYVINSYTASEHLSEK